MQRKCRFSHLLLRIFLPIISGAGFAPTHGAALISGYLYNGTRYVRIGTMIT